MTRAITLNDGKLLWLFALLISLSALENLIEGARYIKYAIGPLSILLWASLGLKIRNERSTTTICLAIYIGWLTISLLWSKSINGAKDVFFIASYTLPLLLFNIEKLKIESLFWLYTLFFAISTLNQNINHFSITESTTFVESASSFVYGAFLIYFLTQKKYFIAALSMIIMLITLKRIALIGVLLCMALWCLPEKIKNNITKTESILAFNIFGLLIIFAITTGFFNDPIQLISGKGTAEFTLGRTYHYIGVIADALQNPKNLIFGNGAGSAYEKAIFDFSNATPNLHSDTLKIFYEAGAIGFVLFFYFIGKSKSPNHRILIIYTSTLFLTDNVLIYSGTMFFIIALALKLESSSQRVEKKTLKDPPIPHNPMIIDGPSAHPSNPDRLRNQKWAPGQSALPRPERPTPVQRTRV